MKRKLVKDFECIVTSHVYIWKFNFRDDERQENLTVRDALNEYISQQSNAFKKENFENKKNLKRLIKNIIKIYDIKYQDLSEELGFESTIIKQLFKQQIEDAELKKQVYYSLRIWSLQKLQHMSKSQFDQLVTNYYSSLQKNDQDADDDIQFSVMQEDQEVIMMQNYPPGIFKVSIKKLFFK